MVGRHELLMGRKWCRCFDELQELLSKVGFQRDRDVLVLAGDFCNKGPQSAAVVKFAREIGALAVVGNHELLSLRARDTMLRAGQTTTGSPDHSASTVVVCLVSVCV